MEQNRVISLDLLKIYAMFLIVLQHLLDIVGYLYITKFNIKYLPIYIFESLSIVAVNIFVLITGFFLIKKSLKWQNLFSLIFEVAAFSWIILITIKLLGIKNFFPNATFNFIFPTFSGVYWFISSYVILYLLFPFINKFIYSLNYKQLKIFAILTIILCCLWGYNLNAKSPFWLMVVYFWGACIRLFIADKKQNFLFLTDKKLHNILLYLSCFFISMTSYIYLNLQGKIFWNLLVFNNIFVFLASLFLFLFVYKINITEKILSRIIVFVAPASLGVYLIHMHPLIFCHVKDLLKQVSLPYNSLSLSILFFSLSIFITCFIASIILHKLLFFLSHKVLCPNIKFIYNNLNKCLTKNDKNIIN